MSTISGNGYSELLEPIRTRENRYPFTDSWILTQTIARKRDKNREALRMRLHYLRCFGRAGENGAKFHTFCGEEKPENFFYEFLKAFKFAATLAHPSPSMKVRIVPPVSSSTDLRWWIAGRKKSCRIKSFKNPSVNDPKFNKNAKFHAFFKVLNTNSYDVRAPIFGYLHRNITFTFLTRLAGFA